MDNLIVHYQWRTITQITSFEYIVLYLWIILSEIIFLCLPWGRYSSYENLNCVYTVLLLNAAVQCIFAGNKNTVLSIQAPPRLGKVIEISALLVIEYANTVPTPGLPIQYSILVTNQLKISQVNRYIMIIMMIIIIITRHGL